MDSHHTIPNTYRILKAFTRTLQTLLLHYKITDEITSNATIYLTGIISRRILSHISLTKRPVMINNVDITLSETFVITLCNVTILFCKLYC
ncbi:hypothetical protein MU1_04140 [Paenibacillus glycanilyticus]|uniref:Uncharacterized protein n=1 Tax=Paenibacillus glycanilyticus TaxID=126569 RepID=A0ABQ6G7U8_9BACL|nr:hypothetical protein MU1_04140 [Paenibacillus glycanilyticus]